MLVAEGRGGGRMIETVSTWAAVKAFLAALPGIAWIVQRFLKRKDAKENKDAMDETDRTAGDCGPGGARRSGRDMRDGMRDSR